MKGWVAYRSIEDMIKNMSIVLPLVNELHSQAMRDRHWKRLAKVCGVKSIDPNDPIPSFIVIPKPGPGSSLIVEWRRLPGKTYEVQATRTLGTPFAPLPSQNIIGNPANGSVQVSDPQASVLFLRVVER